MAGTRLLLQTISVFQIICLATWSFYFGFCHNKNNGDALCSIPSVSESSTTKTSSSCIPKASSSSSNLPKAQVSKALSSSTSNNNNNNNVISWEINKDAESVCQKKQVNQDQSTHPLWLCHQNGLSSLRVINNLSSLIVYYGSEQHLVKSDLLFPYKNVKLPQVIHVQLLLEDDRLSHSANFWMSTVDHWMTKDAKFLNEYGNFDHNYWPCFEDFQINVEFLSSTNIEKWPTKTDATEKEGGGEDEDIESPKAMTYLDKPTKAQVESLVSNIQSVEIIGGPSVLMYIPSILPQKTFTWTATSNTDQQQLLIIPSSPDSLAETLSKYASKWLSELLMGVPSETAMESDDGSFPTWYTAYYHNFLLRSYYTQETDWGTMICDGGDEDAQNSSLEELQLQFDTTTTQESSFERHFPVEHYAAIFAPLLFPLLVPQIAGVVREWKRYKEKTNAKTTTINTNVGEETATTS